MKGKIFKFITNRCVNNGRSVTSKKYPITLSNGYHLIVQC